MSSNGNEYAYARQFIGNLRKESEPVPVRVDTKLRVVIGVTAREVQEYKDHAYDSPPHYVFGIGENLPQSERLYASAAGRHYFTW